MKGTKKYRNRGRRRDKEREKERDRKKVMEVGTVKKKGGVRGREKRERR